MVLCKNCNTALKGKFCHQCGQKIITDKDRTLQHLLEEFFHYFSHLDGKFIKTLKAVLLTPGQVTKDITNGITVKHFKISTFFLIGALVYFLIPQQFIGYGFLNSPYDVQINSGIFREYKEEASKRKYTQLNLSEVEYSKIYDQKVASNGKLLTLLLIPLTIPVLLIISIVLKMIIKSHRYKLYDLAIASLEINSAFVYSIFLLVGITISIINYFFFKNLDYQPLQTFTVVLIMILAAYTLFSFFKRAYSLKWYQALISGIFFFIGYTFVVVAYQFFSFLIIY
jgi:hypothetical protein